MKPAGARIVVVLGMHRSGTSLIARSLEVLGVSLGDRLMPPSDGNNAKGFFEDIDINALNIALMAELDSDWHAITPIAASGFEKLRRDGWVQKALEMLRAKAGNGRVFGFKDPRTAQLLPFWQEVFQAGGMDVKYLLALRNPASVADSLLSRDQLPRERSYYLWFEHMLNSLAATVGSAPALVNYDDFFGDADHVLDQMAAALGFEVDAGARAQFKNEFVDDALRHTVHADDELVSDLSCPPLVAEFYGALKGAERDCVLVDSPALRASIARWCAELESMRPALRLADARLAPPVQPAPEAAALEILKVVAQHAPESLFKVFDRSWYAQAYGDVVAAGLDGYQHYSEAGVYENRLPAPDAVQAARRALGELVAGRDVAAERMAVLEQVRRDGARWADLMELQRASEERKRSSDATLRQSQSELQQALRQLAEREAATVAREQAAAQAADQAAQRHAAELRDLLTQAAQRESVHGAAISALQAAQAEQLAALTGLASQHQRLHAQQMEVARDQNEALLCELADTYSTAQEREAALRTEHAAQLAMLERDRAPLFVDQANQTYQMYTNNQNQAEPTVAYLLSFHDEKFVHVAYNTLLGRTPDPDGLAYYLSRVRSGISKIEILAQLRLSEEGKARNVPVSGLEKEIKRLKNSKIPLVGPVFKLFAGSGPGDDTLKNLRAIENKLNAIEDNLKRHEATSAEPAMPIRLDNTPVDARYNSIASRKQRFQAEKHKGSDYSVQADLTANQAKAGLAANPLSKKFHDAMFDLHWYGSVHPMYTTKSEVMRNYEALARTNLDIISPSPYFSLAFYSQADIDTHVEKEKLYEHFIAAGCQEGRDPHPLFMSDWYRETYKLDSDVIPFVHYIEEGWQQGYRPHPAFWSDWYVDQYPGVWGDPLYHYLTEGWKKGYLPNPVFEPEWYRKESKSAVTVVTDLFTDYLTRSPQELISPHPLFDPAYYAAGCHNGGIHIPGNIHHLVHFFMSGGGVDPHPLFDSSHYLSQGPTVAHSYPMVDFIMSEPEYRDPNPFFSCRHYLLRRPDVAGAGINPLLHYLRSGTSEPCFPHPLFDNSLYLNQYPDVGFAKVVPLKHYMLSGRFEGRICRPVQTPILSAQRKPRVAPALISLKEISATGAAKSSEATKGVFAHVFYPDLLDEVISASNNVPAPCRLFVTTDTPAKAKVIEDKSKSSSVHPVEVRLVENRGRDIAPMIVSFADRLREVDLAVHIHTKKSMHYAKEFDAWRHYLINSNMGSKAIVANILSLFDNPDVGMVAPEDFGPINPLIQWGGNLQNVQALVGMMTNNELDISADNLLELPSGSMFWFRTKALAPLLDLELKNYQFDPEAGQVDGTLAHAIERAFFFVGEIAGYGWVRFKIHSDSKSQGTSFERNKHVQRILPLRSRKSALVIKYPETRSFSPVVSLVPRPRLNLLIPSADLSKGYAGASEALRIFNGLKNSLRDRFDFRVISTDIPFSNQHHVESTQSIVDLYEDHAECHDVVSDGTKRTSVPISIRQGDFFVASAWWTAHIARDIRKWQAETYDSIPDKFVYLIQDYESGFYPWSTQAMLAEATYLNAADILPIFNTQILADFFEEKGYFDKCLAYQPPMNEEIVAALDPECERENLVLIYMRPHALRNGIEFADALVQNVLRKDPDFWKSWKFIAIGEDFSAASVLQTGAISVHGRLSLNEYADYLSRARLGISLMVSPHPSYPPLEMAGSGLLVLTNTYANKDLSSLHQNLRSFDAFDLQRVGEQFKAMAEESLGNPEGRAMSDWFFGGKTNFSEVICGASKSILEMSNLVSPDRGAGSPAAMQQPNSAVQ